jgi:hypothetical protein
MDTMTWSIGIGVSLILGWPVTEGFLYVLRRAYGIEKPSRVKRVPSWLTGIVERLFFTIAVAYNVGGSITAMIGWIAVKLASRWIGPDNENGPGARFLAFSSVLGGLVSMLFALVGGLIAGGAFF